MLDGYQNIFAKAGGQLNRAKRIAMPNVNLGIGEAEILNPIHIKQAITNVSNPQKILQPYLRDTDDLDKNGLGSARSLDDFPKDYYYGEAL
jgi:hypothetical protein